MAKPASKPAASNATWVAKQGSEGEWNAPENWKPGEVPTTKAGFGAGARRETDVSFAASSKATVGEIAFSPSAPSYTFTFTESDPAAPTLTIAGRGVSNKSTNPQTFRVEASASTYKKPQLKFTNSATAGGHGTSYFVGPATPKSAGGGVISFAKDASAGSASFTVTTGAGTPPKENSTVGGEVSFSNSASADKARFTIYGSTSKTDGDTFGNAVFHDTSTAASAQFTNAGGTVAGGDGGNTQFYNKAKAANGLFQNLGAVVGKANGGDVAFDGTSNASDGLYHNYAATAAGGNGGVTSFNNNPPHMKANQGSSAGSGMFHNYGAKAKGEGGGHTFFTAKGGSPTADRGNFFNYGSAVPGKPSSAGHTVFSISLPQEHGDYYPTAGNGTFWNLPGLAKDAPGGYTEFAMYDSSGGKASDRFARVPTAGRATFVNVGGAVEGARGGYTVFRGTTNAGKAVLVAESGSNGGEGGRIEFGDESSGWRDVTIRLFGNGVLDVTDHEPGDLRMGYLEMTGGVLETSLDAGTTRLEVRRALTINAAPARFEFTFGPKFSVNRSYIVLRARNLADFSVDHFTGNQWKDRWPTFRIVRDWLQVTYRHDGERGSYRRRDRSR